MSVVTRKLTQLKCYEQNARHNQEAIPKVEKSIERYGYKVFIVIDNDDVIVAGHTRFAALRNINARTGQYEEIECILADDLTPEQIREFRIVDNSTAAIATWDWTTLKIELETLNFDLEEFGGIKGFSELEIHDEVLKSPDLKEDSLKIQIGPQKIDWDEASYHQWAAWVVETQGMSVIEFVTRALKLNPEDRDYDDPDI